MNPQDLQPCSFRGVRFPVVSTTLAGGRRVVQKRFPNSDLQAVEDLGLLPRQFTVAGIVAARRDAGGAELQTYEEVRDALVAALERKGPGVLVHPFLGRFDSASVVSFNLNEDTTRLGDATIEIVFTLDTSDARPQPTESVVGSVSRGSGAVTAAVKADVPARFEVTETFAGNFADAIEKVTEVVDKVREAVEVIAADEDEVDEFGEQADGFEDQVVALVNDPTLLGNDAVDLVNAVAGLYTSSADAFDSLTRLFNFGDDDVAIQRTTAGRIERATNRDVLNSAVQASALSQAYLAAAQTEFSTVDEIDEVSEALENQWQKLLASGEMGEAVEEALAVLRVTTTKFFDEQRDLRPQLVTVTTEFTSARLLAYQYYGASALGETIALLNEFDDAAGIEGEVQVLSA